MPVAAAGLDPRQDATRRLDDRYGGSSMAAVRQRQSASPSSKTRQRLSASSWRRVKSAGSRPHRIASRQVYALPAHSAAEPSGHGVQVLPAVAARSRYTAVVMPRMSA